MRRGHDPVHLLKVLSLWHLGDRWPEGELLGQPVGALPQRGRETRLKLSVDQRGGAAKRMSSIVCRIRFVPPNVEKCVLLADVHMPRAQERRHVAAANILELWIHIPNSLLVGLNCRRGDRVANNLVDVLAPPDGETVRQVALLLGLQVAIEQLAEQALTPVRLVLLNVGHSRRAGE